MIGVNQSKGLCFTQMAFACHPRESGDDRLVLRYAVDVENYARQLMVSSRP